MGPQRKVKQDHRWINDICYVDSGNNEHSVGVLECLEEKPGASGAPTTIRFPWITDFKLKANPDYSVLRCSLSLPRTTLV